MGFLTELFGLTQFPESGGINYGALDGAPAGKASPYGVHDMPAFTFKKDSWIYRALGALGFLNNREDISAGAGALDKNFALPIYPWQKKDGMKPRPRPAADYPIEALKY